MFDPMDVLPDKLSQGEIMRMSRLQQANSLAQEDIDNGTLTPDEGQELLGNIRQQIMPLKARLGRQMQQAEQEAQAQVQKQMALAEAIQHQSAVYRAKGLEERIAVVTDPTDGERMHMFEEAPNKWKRLEWPSEQEQAGATGGQGGAEEEGSIFTGFDAAAGGEGGAAGEEWQWGGAGGDFGQQAGVTGRHPGAAFHGTPVPVTSRPEEEAAYERHMSQLIDPERQREALAMSMGAGVYAAYLRDRERRNRPPQALTLNQQRLLLEHEIARARREVAAARLHGGLEPWMETEEGIYRMAQQRAGSILASLGQQQAAQQGQQGQQAAGGMQRPGPNAPPEAHELFNRLQMLDRLNSLPDQRPLPRSPLSANEERLRRQHYLEEVRKEYNTWLAGQTRTEENRPARHPWMPATGDITGPMVEQMIDQEADRRFNREISALRPHPSLAGRPLSEATAEQWDVLRGFRDSLRAATRTMGPNQLPQFIRQVQEAQGIFERYGSERAISRSPDAARWTELRSRIAILRNPPTGDANAEFFRFGRAAATETEPPFFEFRNQLRGSSATPEERQRALDAIRDAEAIYRENRNRGPFDNWPEAVRTRYRELTRIYEPILERAREFRPPTSWHGSPAGIAPF